MALGHRTILFELTQVGQYVRVCAIDERTGLEVTMVGDPQQGEETLKRLAARKLMYVMEKKARAAESRR